ncbi:hypothetical protein J3F81_003538 [Coemansia sp. RSA 371]|nr:hypothetical protein J3F81_003538 [Coemansia sp. RSA 371]
MFTSPFQTLPPLIIDQVLRYILLLPTGLHSVSPFTISASNDDIRPLYHTCHAWRSAALTLMFARCKAVLGETVSFSLNLNKSASHISNSLDAHLTQYVKTITMNIDYTCIADGSVLSRLESSYGMLYFTNAHSLVVEIRVGDSCHTGGLELSGIAERTVQLIKDMTPPLNNIRLCIKDDAPESEGEQYRQLQTLIQGLTRTPLLSHLELAHPCKQYIIESCSPVCNLTTLTCVWDKSCESLAHIMHANANSLLELYISYASFDNLERLVVDEHGYPVVYPHLATLFFRDIGTEANDYSPVLESVAPFPQLRVFQSQIMYPFGDDTVFRGNASSLEDIYLMGDYKIIKMLYGCGVFAQGRLKSLRKLMVADSVVEIDNVDAVIGTYMTVIDNVLPSLKELRALDADISNALIV